MCKDLKSNKPPRERALGADQSIHFLPSMQFESQDVLIPWHRPSSDPCPAPPDAPRTCYSTCTTTNSEDDGVHYNAYTQTSDSGTEAGGGRSKEQLQQRYEKWDQLSNRQIAK